jgi:dethiobiotin synthetase
VVIGTGTDVGKTFVTARRLAALRATGVRVAARKPVQSFAPSTAPTDAEVLAAATGEAPDEVCPPHRWLAAAMAPPMATEALGLPPITIAELVGEIDFPDGVEEGVVETIGGVRSPVADNGDSVDLLAALAPDAVLLVTHPGLGTINDVRLAVAAVAAMSSAPVEVVLNRFDATDDVHNRNFEWLSDRDGFSVTTETEEVRPS